MGNYNGGKEIVRGMEKRKQEKKIRWREEGKKKKRER